MGTSIGACCGVDVIIQANNIDSADPDHTIETKSNVELDTEFQFRKSHKTKLALSSAYLLTEIIEEHFLSLNNKCDFMNNDEHIKLIQSILNGILIQGGACRDLLLSKPIKDIDIQCNTRELTKIHLIHLKKYHSTKDSQKEFHSCSLWNHYLNKFTEESKLYDINVMNEYKIHNNEEKKQNLMKSSKYIKDCDYVLNAKYITNLIVNCPMFRDKVNVQNIDITAFDALLFHIDIVQDVMFNGFNLNGQDFDLLDLINKNFSTKSYRRQQPKLLNQPNNNNNTELHRGFHSIRMDSISKEYYNELHSTHDLIELDLPIYECTLDRKLSGTDLSINCLVLPLSVVYNVFHKIDKNGTFDITKNVHNELKSHLICAAEYDIKSHIKNKVLTATKLAVIAQTPSVHFWRVIKFSVRYMDEGWKINSNLMKIHQNCYNEWINNKEYMKNIQNQRNVTGAMFGGILISLNFKTANQYKKMLKSFNILKFDAKLKNQLEDNKEFKAIFCDSLNKKNQEIQQIFKEFNYPLLV